MKNNHLMIAAMNAATLAREHQHPGNPLASPLHGLTKKDLAAASKLLSEMLDDPLLSVFDRRDYLLAKGWVPASAAYHEHEIPTRPSVSITGAPTGKVGRAGMDMIRGQLETVGHTMHSGAAETVWAATLICRALEFPYEVIVIRDECFKAAGVRVQRTDIPQRPAELKKGWSASVAESFDPQNEPGA